jgi:hypothetical protein
MDLYRNLDVLKEVNLVPTDWGIETLSDFDLNIAPRANLVRNPGALVYGILATVVHSESSDSMQTHAEGVLAETYLPEAVLADKAGRFRQALSYIASDMITRPAERFGFPRCVERIRSFALSLP